MKLKILMLSTLLTIGALAAGELRPVFIVNAKVRALDIWAPSQKDALLFAEFWKDSYDVPMTKPAALPGDKSLVLEAWYATSSVPPGLGTAPTIPTADQWKLESAKEAAPADMDWWQNILAGYSPSPIVKCVNHDHPSWAPSWLLWRVYITEYRSSVWYFDALSASSATTKAKAMWITGGAYFYPTIMRWEEWNTMRKWWQPNATGTSADFLSPLPKLPWLNLIVNLAVKRSAGDDYEVISSAMPKFSVPKDYRDLTFYGRP